MREAGSFSPRPRQPRRGSGMNPLAGRTVGVLRAEAQAQGLVSALRRAGATPFARPVIAAVPPASLDRLDAALSASAPYDWIVFTSANAAEAVAARLATGRCALPGGARLAAIGAATAVAVRAFGSDVFVSPRPDAMGLADALPVGRGTRVLVPAGSLAGPGLRERLVERGASVEVVTAYQTVPDHAGIAALAERLRREGLDALLFTSGSTVRFLLQALAPDARAALAGRTAGPVCVSIGPATTAVAREYGLRVAATAITPTEEGMLDALRHAFDHDA